MPYAVCVTFKIHHDHIDAFLPLMQTNAAQSLRDEPGCQRFDVLTDADRPGEVFLYELYDHLEAFQMHLGSPHFKAFETAAAPMISEKTVRTYATVVS